jgi:hypothetical protein
MKLFQSSQDRDLELLSAYIDDELSASERAALERRLASDSALRRTLSDLHRVQATLHALPTVKIPRSFTLKPEMVGQPARQPVMGRFIPALNFATTLAAILFAVVIGSQLATGKPLAAPVAAPLSAQVANAPADSQTAPAEAPSTASQKSLTAPAVTEFAPTVDQAPGGCGGDGSQEPLTGGGCSGGGTGGAGDVSPFAFSVLNGTGTPAETPNATQLADGTLAVDTTVATGITTESGTPAIGESVPPSNGNGTRSSDPDLTGTPAPDTFSTLNNYATTPEVAPVVVESQSNLFTTSLLELGLGVLLVLLILASVLIRRR